MRYLMRPIINNNFETYEELRERRGLRKINHFKTPKLRHLHPAQMRKLNRITHVWKIGDRYYKLAHKHYGDSKYWWVIAWYNKRPTESHVQLGDLVFVPQPLEDVLRYLGI